MSDWDVVETTPAALQTDPEPADDTLTLNGGGGSDDQTAQDNDPWGVAGVTPVARPEQARQIQASPPSGDDEWAIADTQPAPAGEWSAPQSFAAGAAKGAVPTTAGLAAGLYAGAAATPALTPVGGILVGLGVGAVTSWMAGMGQDKLLAAMGFDKPLHEAEQANPYSFFAGEAAPSALLLKPTGDLIQRGIGAAIGGGAEAINETLSGGGYDLGKIGIAAGVGAALPSTNRYGSKILAAGDQVAGRYRRGNTAENPDLKEIPAEPGVEPEITIADTPTPEQMEAANVPANVAQGTADVKPPPTEVPTAGNPEGAPMYAREAARPSDPVRDYAKETHASIRDAGVVETKSPVSPDMAEALRGNNPEQVRQPEATADVTAPREAAPTSPEPADVLPRPEPVADPAQERPAKPVPAAEAPAPERVQTGLTPEEIRVAATARRALQELGYTRLLAEIDRRKLSPKQIAQTLTQAYNASRSATGEAVGRTTGEVRTETPRQKVSTGVVASSKADAARKEGAIKFAVDNYKEFGPGSEKGGAIDPLDPAKLKETRQWAKDTWAEIVKRNKGVDPTVRSKNQYVPLKQGEGHTEAYQWLKALKASATGQNHRNFATAHTAKGMGAAMRETGKIEGDIARRPQLPEAAEAAETSVEQGSGPREQFDPIPLREGKDNTFAKQYNEVVDWVNNLSERDYAVLADHYKENLRPEIIDMMEPRDTLSEMMDVIKQAGRREAPPPEAGGKTPAGEVTAEVELPAKKVDLPEVKPAARTLDKNSDEFKRLAAQYNQQAAKEKPLTREEQIARSEAKERSLSDAANAKEERTTIDATNPESVWKAAAEAITRAEEIMAQSKDKYGAGNLEMRRRNLLQRTALDLWMRFRNPASPSTPAASQPVKDYANSLSEKFRRLSGDTLHRKLDLQGNLHAAIAEAATQKITPYHQRQISLAEQDNRIGALPQKLRDYYDKFVVPVREQALAMAREMRDLNDQHNLGWDLSDIGKVTTKSYQPRYRVGLQSFDDKATNAAFDPFTGRTLGGIAPNLMDRQWYALESGNNRLVFEKLDADTIRLWMGNRPTLRVKVPPDFTGTIGDTLNLKVKGKNTKFTVDQGTTHEIEKATNGQVKFHENSLWQWTRMADDMTLAVEQTKLYQSIRSAPEYQALMTTDRKTAQERGYSLVKTHLPDFATDGPYKKDVYLPDAVRWALDDYHRPGFGVTSEGLERLRNFNVAMLKVFNTNAPLVHVMNELNLFTVGRGGKWLNPVGNAKVVGDITTAVRSVNTQDALQREMRNAGVNPLLAATKVGGMYKRAAEQFGLEVTRDWRLWDAPFKPWGLTAKEVGDKAYHLSSDVTWRLSDYLTTLRYMEERRAGWAPEDAAKRVNKFMSDYQLDTTVMGSRALQQVLADPATTSFGRYKAGVWRSLAHMTKDLVKGDPMLREQAGKAGFGKAMTELKARQEALGQMIAVGVIATVIGPVFDGIIKKISGDENAEFRARGVNAPVHAALKFREKGVQGVIAHAWTPSPALNATGELVKNKTFSNKEIIPTGDLPGIIPEAAANMAEYAAQTAVPPYATVSKTYSRPEGSVGMAFGNLALEQIGADIKSEAAVKRESQIERVLNQGAKQRMKRPGGIIPDLYNRATE